MNGAVTDGGIPANNNVKEEKKEKWGDDVPYIYGNLETDCNTWKVLNLSMVLKS